MSEPNISLLEFGLSDCMFVCSLFKHHAKSTQSVQAMFSLFKNVLLNLKTETCSFRKGICGGVKENTLLLLALLILMGCRCSFTRKVHKNQLLKSVEGVRFET